MSVYLNVHATMTQTAEIAASPCPRVTASGTAEQP
jgi:hypothetical protein